MNLIKLPFSFCPHYVMIYLSMKYMGAKNKMKQLIIMQGSVGSGKSTWIKDNGLSDYSLSFDKFELLVGGYNTENLDGHLLPANKSKLVYSLFISALESRMLDGQLTVIDSQNLRTEDINEFHKFANKYNYETFVVQLKPKSIDETRKIVTKRNTDESSDLENNKYIPESVIEKSYKLRKHVQNPNWVLTLDSETAINDLNITYQDISMYKGLIVIGDIHSSYRVLKHSWEELDIDNKLRDNWLVITLGDLFDRGIRPVETFKFLENKKQNFNNFKMIMGNHDFNLYNEVFKTVTNPSKKTHQETTAKLLEAGINFDRIRDFLRAMKAGMFLQNGNKHIILTHGGILPTKTTSELELNKRPDRMMLFGSGNFADPIDEKLSHFPNLISIHGHRNAHKVDMITENEGMSINLEQGVDEGYHLAIAEYLISEDKINTYKFKNEEFQLSQTAISELMKRTQSKLIEEPNSFLLQAKHADSLRVKQLDNRIYSINFTNESFISGNWDELNITARGLFIDKEHNEVFARGYNKFFKVGEQENTWKSIKPHLPYSVYKKYNGFLAMLTYDKYSDKLVVMSKTQLDKQKTPFVLLAKKIIMKMINDSNQDLIKKVLLGKTALFEIVDEKKNPHLVHNFDKPTAVLLDIVNNNLSKDFHNNRMGYSDLVKFANKVKFPVKELITTIDDTENIKTELESLKLTISELEGYVLESDDGFQVKVKTYLYTSGKAIRNKYNYAYKHKLSGDEFLKSIKNIDNSSDENIIGARHNLINNYNDLKQIIAKLIDEHSSKEPASILDIRKGNNLII